MTKKISMLALFTAFSVVGAMIKIPSFVGSIALDAFPALLAGVLIGRKEGMVVAIFGHLLSALIAGFPLGPMHGIIGLEMAVIVWCFTAVYQTGKKIVAGLLFVMGNSIVAALPFWFLFGSTFYLALLPSLFAGSVLNVVIALVCIPKCIPFFEKQLRFSH